MLLPRTTGFASRCSGAIAKANLHVQPPRISPLALTGGGRSPTINNTRILPSTSPARRTAIAQFTTTPHPLHASRKQMPSRPKPPPEEEIEESFLKGSGPGGQKINKTNSAVQLKHIPTGIVVKCQETRSRESNRKIARQLLAQKLDILHNGDQSRWSIVGTHKKKKADSAAKKSRRKYRKLAEEKEAAEGSEGAATAAAPEEEGGQQERVEGNKETAQVSINAAGKGGADITPEGDQQRAEETSSGREGGGVERQPI